MSTTANRLGIATIRTTANRLGIATIRLTNSFVNAVVLIIIVLLLFFAGYALWDSEQIYHMADKSVYEVYKPTVANEGKSFKELQDINSEVFAWLTVYGTNIDYPVTQAQNNMKYVSTNAEGQYALTGSIFLDYENSRDFSDFNSIVYGHHMQKQTMFGEIGNFAEREMFDTHRYGNLYFDGKDHGLEFFAFIHCDAYDSRIFAANIQGEEAQQVYLDYLYAKATYIRDIGVSINDHIILLSTCSATSTNGRDILVGRIAFTTYEDPFAEVDNPGGEVRFKVDSPGDILKLISQWWLPILLLILAVLLLIIVLIIFRRRRQKRNLAKSTEDADPYLSSQESPLPYSMADVDPYMSFRESRFQHSSADVEPHISSQRSRFPFRSVGDELYISPHKRHYRLSEGDDDLYL